MKINAEDSISYEIPGLRSDFLLDGLPAPAQEDQGAR